MAPPCWPEISVPGKENFSNWPDRSYSLLETWNWDSVIVIQLNCSLVREVNWEYWWSSWIQQNRWITERRRTRDEKYHSWFLLAFQVLVPAFPEAAGTLWVSWDDDDFNETFLGTLLGGKISEPKSKGKREVKQERKKNEKWLVKFWAGHSFRHTHMHMHTHSCAYKASSCAHCIQNSLSGTWRQRSSSAGAFLFLDFHLSKFNLSRLGSLVFEAYLLLSSGSRSHRRN